jgi:predicted ATPase/class 3 adenylate cyclase
VRTFLFTDIEGSTRLWEQSQDAMREALAEHDRIVGRVIAEHRGRVFKTVGDAFCAVFDAVDDAARAAIALQQALARAAWPTAAPLRVRVAIHRGPAEERAGDFFGPSVNRVARVLATAHGGQIVLSQSARDRIADALPDGATLIDLSSHRLKDLGQPEHIWQLGHPDLEAEFPRLRSLQAYANNIPVQVSSFIGRVAEMETVKSMVRAHRLVTVTGSGGCGKTRLALQVATELIESYADGVWLVELAALSDQSLTVLQTATALGLREGPDGGVEQTLADYVRDKTILIILDNCEHVIDECARLVERLLAGSPNLTVLCTSREPLDIPGERSWRIPSLPRPKLGIGESIDNPASALLAYDSVRLFVERAKETVPAFEFADSSACDVAAICRRLDGIPLAIELAAASVRTLSAKQISDRLDDRFRLLTGGKRTAPDRQKTLRGTLDWSYDLLSGSEQTLLTRVAVFSGGWTVEAAEEICSGDGIDRRDVLDLLGRLVSKSLILAHSSDDAVRYGMLESIREYAAAKLADLPPDQVGSLRDRHVDWFARYAKQVASDLRSGDIARNLDRLATDSDNVVIALDWCSRNPSLGQEGLDLTASLSIYWYSRGQASEGLRLTDIALSHPHAREPNAIRAGAYHAAGNLASAKGDFRLARSFYEQSLTIRRAVNDSAGIASLLNNIGTLETRQGRYKEAERYLTEALELSRAQDNRFLVANACNNLGNCVKAGGDFEAAKTYYLECLRISREILHESMEATSLNNLGCIELDECRYGAAIALFETGIAINRKLGDIRQVASNLPDLALAQLESGDSGAALASADEACRLADEAQDTHHLALAQHVRASVELSLGHNADARDLCARCLRGFLSTNDRESAAKAAMTFAEIDANEQHHERVATLLAVVASIRDEIGAPMPPRERAHADRIAAAAAAALDHSVLTQCRDRGRAMTLRDALEFALL